VNSVRQTALIEDVPNIRTVLGRRLRAVGIATPSALLKVGDAESFASRRVFPGMPARTLASPWLARCAGYVGGGCRARCATD
jgi:hypothetical protein